MVTAGYRAPRHAPAPKRARERVHAARRAVGVRDGLRTDADVLRSASEAPGARPPTRAAPCGCLSLDRSWYHDAGDCRAAGQALDARAVRRADCRSSAERHPGVAPGEPKRPTRSSESARRRAERAGGYVCVGDHSLPMTRALGDLLLKVARGNWRDATVHEQVVTALPDVRFVASPTTCVSPSRRTASTTPCPPRRWRSAPWSSWSARTRARPTRR